ncbi:MAG: N-acetyl-1-D-myo-inositol-2-amino-2-deoxy-alpha-D-glucopyranoside deacetylase [Chloroflexaceae bacterium]|nr:N-acetyl-1-D-myo-inositol-2-amino-2-deoxy-alpha-D-glucopyranoside deacetylase [Chloroflexaceae bacterium]NJO06193.1 N-acetyl-1-D-myo-inositol-2-amino-2-deoxy-alpha-D-glucopyranoside deacetylase [Chloroflexaceae bacterium]
MTTELLTIMAVHAHPDDECFTTGGSLARYSAEGINTVLIIATGGEAGEIVVEELATPENYANLRELRDKELACSVEKLGINVLERLGYHDSGMEGTEANHHPESFHMADKDEATARLVALVRKYKPQVLVSYDERGGYGHPDHIACHQITVAAFEAAGDATRYPDWGAPWTPLKLYYASFPRTKVYNAWLLMKERGFPTPLDDPEFDVSRFTVEDERVTTHVPVHAYMEQKRSSIDCHITQIRKDSAFLSVPDDIAYDLFGYEYYILVAARVDLPDRGDTMEDDLFAGLR